MPSHHYIVSTDIFDDGLARAMYEHLGEATIITFGLAGTAYTSTELRLSPALVEKGRKALDLKRADKRQVYIKEPRARFGGREEAKVLARAGFTATIIAYALAVDPTTVYRWKLEAASKALTTITKDPETYKLGFDRVQLASPGHRPRDRDLLYYQVGTAIKLLAESPKRKTTSAERAAGQKAVLERMQKNAGTTG